MPPVAVAIILVVAVVALGLASMVRKRRFEPDAPELPAPPKAKSLPRDPG